MDRKFLSDAAVVAASREFVCVRLSTYESQAEAEFLSGLFRTRSGQLENSVFAILDPTGERKLVRSGRSPEWVFDDAAAMAEGMTEIAARYREPERTAQPVRGSALGVPWLADSRLALNVAACDGQRLVVVRSPDDQAARQALDELAAALAWDQQLQGRLLWVRDDGGDALSTIEEGAPGLLVVEPDSFGESPRHVAFVPADCGLDGARSALQRAAAANQRGSVDARAHIREGRQRGVHWETVIPVTDPGGRRGPRRP